MALRRISVPWTSQPQEAAGIDWANPLTRGLAAVQLPDGRNVVNGRPSVDSGAVALGAMPIGRVLVLDRASPYRRSVAVQGHASDATLLCVGALTAGLAGYQGMAVVANGTTRRMFIGEASSNRYNFSATPSGGSQQIAGLGDSINSLAGAPQVLVGVVRGTTISLYRNGTDEGGGKTIASQNFSDATSCSASWNGFLESGDGYVGLVAYWIGRALTADEISAISANPWQLFAPRQIWVPVSAGGSADGTITGSTLTATASLLPGELGASGVLDGQVLTAAASLLPGDLQAGTQISGAVLEASASLLPGELRAGSVLAGALLPAQAALLAGVLAGEGNATIDGAVLPATALLLPGVLSSTGNAQVIHGETMGASVSLISGALLAGSALQGQTLTATAGLLPGILFDASTVGGSGRPRHIGIHIGLRI